MDNITISLKALARLTEKSQAELTELLTFNSEDAENKPTQGDIDAKIIDSFTPKFQKLIKDTKGRSAKEILEIKEKELAEKYGVSKTSDLITLVDNIVTEQVGKNSTKEITKEDALNHPEVKAAISKFKSERDELKNSIKQAEQKAVRDALMGKVRAKAKETLLGLNPVLSKDEAKKQKQINLFLSQFDSLDYQVKEDGSILVLENGKPRQDADYNDITVSKLVNELNLFDLSNDTGKKPTAQPPKGGDPVTHNFSKEDLTTNFSKKVRELGSKGDLQGVKNLQKAREQHLENNN